MTPDVVIVGGGPAGLAAAIVCARNGLPTVLIERRAFPVDKPCGEGLLPNAVAALGGLGVSAPDLDAAGQRLTGIRYVSSRGRIAEAAFPGGCGVGIARSRLSQLLVNVARCHPSLEIVEGQAATVSTSPRGGVSVSVGARTFRPRLVGVADGLRSRVAGALGMGLICEGLRRWGVRQHFDLRPWASEVEVYFADGCEAYVTPVGNAVNVAFLWAPGDVTLPAGESAVDALIGRVPRLKVRMGGAAKRDRARGSGPFRCRPRELARDGVVLLGDASGYVDPITGEGVGLALLQAEVFERQVVPELLRGTGVVRHAHLERFRVAVDQASASNRRLTRLLLEGARRSWVVERVIGALGDDPALFQHCLSANMGARPLWRIGPPSALRLALRLAGVPRVVGAVGL